jgi:hypothetical protein
MEKITIKSIDILSAIKNIMAPIVLIGVLMGFVKVLLQISQDGEFIFINIINIIMMNTVRGLTVAFVLVIIIIIYNFSSNFFGGIEININREKK